MIPSDFHQFSLPDEAATFAALSGTVSFEATGKGRLGNHLVRPDGDGIPLVRTTSRYTTPAHCFSEAHQALADQIAEAAPSDSVYFNNALIEIYDRRYRKMGYHSDQSLDLDPDSWIALYSCYEYPEALTDYDTRKLKVKPKGSEEEQEIKLGHQSVVLFSVAGNRHYQHKIVLDTIRGITPPEPENRWLGLTFRCSKTHVRFQGGVPYLPGPQELTMATEAEQHSFYQLRSAENHSTDFSYPPLHYTLSAADRMPPVPAG